ncbi:MAG: ankyrin repeat domain-containing protein, partial [Brevinema sp.]
DQKRAAANQKQADAEAKKKAAADQKRAAANQKQADAEAKKKAAADQKRVAANQKQAEAKKKAAEDQKRAVADQKQAEAKKLATSDVRKKVTGTQKPAKNNKKNQKPEPPKEPLVTTGELNWSIYNNNYSLFKQLIELSNANYNKLDRDGSTPLLIAAAVGNNQMVKYLLKKGANPNSANFMKFTPLMMASEFGHLSVIKTLLKTKKITNINEENRMGYNAIMRATYNGHVPTVRFLLAKGGEFKIDPTDSSSMLMQTILQQNSKMVKYMVSDIDKDIYQLNVVTNKILKKNQANELAKAKLLADQKAIEKAEKKNTAKAGDKKADAKKLTPEQKKKVAANAKKKAAEAKKKSAEAKKKSAEAKKKSAEAKKKSAEDKKAMAELAKKKSAEAKKKKDLKNQIIPIIKKPVTLTVNYTDKNGYTALMYALNIDNVAIANRIMNKKDTSVTNISKVDRDAPIILAATTTNSFLIKNLVKKGANLNTKNKYGITPLMKAAQVGNLENVKLLVKLGALVTDTDKRSISVLQYASQSGNIELYDYILKLVGPATVKR